MKCDDNSDIEGVLRCIDANGKKVAFLVDSNNVMTGLLTDGDVRRLLLNGHGMKEKAALYARKDFRFAYEKDSPEDIAKLFDERVTILPVLDESNFVPLPPTRDLHPANIS